MRSFARHSTRIAVCTLLLAGPLWVAADEPPSATDRTAEDRSPQSGAGAETGGWGLRRRGRRWLDVSAGSFFGRRAFELTTPDGFRLEQKTPLLGARGDLEARVFAPDEIRAAVDVAGGLRYAPFSGGRRRSSNGPAGTYLSGTVSGEYVAALAHRLAGYGRVGAEVTTYGLESNAEYVGNLYWLGEVGLGAVYRPARGFAADLSAGVQPVLSARTNRRAFDHSSPTLGARARLELSGMLVPRLRLKFFYDVQYLHLRHPDPRSHPGPGTGRDLLQVGGLSLSWRFWFPD